MFGRETSIIPPLGASPFSFRVCPLNSAMARRMNTYKKAPRNSPEMNTYKIIGLKVVQNEHLKKYRGEGGRNSPSAQQIFELGAQIGLFVAVLHDDRRIERQTPLFAASVRDWTRAGYHHGLLGNHQRLLAFRAVNLAAHQVIY